MYPNNNNMKNNILYNNPKELDFNKENSNILKHTILKNELKYVSVNYQNSSNIYFIFNN